MVPGVPTGTPPVIIYFFPDLMIFRAISSFSIIAVISSVFLYSIVLKGEIPQTIANLRHVFLIGVRAITRPLGRYREIILAVLPL